MSGTISPTTQTSAAGSASGQSALGSLTNNYQAFLKMLTTQLQNQDPTSPMDSSQFTSELVQFSSVEQQIATNTNLTTLIQLAQGNAVLQSGQIVGKQVQATSPQLTLQNGAARVDFNAPSAGPVAVTVYGSNGRALQSATFNAAQGANTWNWNGQTATGVRAPDGAYTVGVAAIAADGRATKLPFTVVGKATSVTQKGANVTLDMGSLAVSMANVTAVLN